MGVGIYLNRVCCADIVYCNVILDKRPHGLRVKFCEYSLKRRRLRTGSTRIAECVVEISRRNRLSAYCDIDDRNVCGKGSLTRGAIWRGRYRVRAEQGRMFE